jgi:hypothetical protein
MNNLASRIVEDNACVIEGDLAELREAQQIIISWIMIEETKERNVDFAWVKQLNKADDAIEKYIKTLID